MHKMDDGERIINTILLGDLLNRPGRFTASITGGVSIGPQVAAFGVNHTKGTVFGKSPEVFGAMDRKAKFLQQSRWTANQIMRHIVAIRKIVSANALPLDYTSQLAQAFDQMEDLSAMMLKIYLLRIDEQNKSGDNS